MKIIKVFVTDVRIQFHDITEVGDPAPKWRMMRSKTEASGVGFLEDHTRVILDPIPLSSAEEQALSELLESIATRLAK